MRFTFRQLKYFVAAAKYGSIKAASQQIYISQPAVSTAISQLEEELGAQLFLRNHAKGLSLTPTGRRVLTEAEAAIRAVERIADVATEGRDCRNEQFLNIGFFTTLAALMLPEMSSVFGSIYPNIRLKPCEGSQKFLFDALRNADIEIAITYELHIPNDLNFYPLAELPTYAYVSEDDAIATKKEVSITELAKKPLILVDIPLLSEYYIRLFEQNDLSPNISFRSSNVELVAAMVAGGAGFGIGNVRPRRRFVANGTATALVGIAEQVPMKLGLLCSKNLHLSVAAEAFEHYCRATISDHTIPGMAPSISQTDWENDAIPD